MKPESVFKHYPIKEITSTGEIIYASEKTN